LISYLDTSLLVAALTNEAKSTAAQAWLAEQEVGEIAISEWVATELFAALSAKLRSRQIENVHRTNALAEFARLRAASFVTLAVTSQHFRMAAEYAGRHGLGLRAGDALHLAVAADNGATLCTLDRRLAGAGKTVGVKIFVL